MITKPGQSKRAVMIELVLLAILGFVAVYSRIPHPAPAADRVSAPIFVATPAPVPTWSFSVIPDNKPVQAKAKKPHKVAKSAPVAKTVLVQISSKPVQAAPEPAPAHDIKEAIIPITEPASKTIAATAPETVPVVKEAPATAPKAVEVSDALATAPDAEPAPIANEAQVTTPRAEPVPNETLDMASETKSSPTPKALPASVFSPAQTAPPEPVSPARSLVTGTTAALIFAPIAAPVSIIFGIASAIFTPTSSQLDQERPSPAVPKKRAVRASAPSSDSSY